MFKNELFLALSYLKFHKGKTFVLSLSFTVLIALPTLLSQVQENLEELSLKRAKSTPLILGSKGSQLELTLHALYFSNSEIKSSRFGVQKRLDKITGIEAIPLHSRFTAEKRKIIGTTEAYLEKRSLSIAEGKMNWQLGDCLIGAKVAKDLKLSIGDKLRTDVKNAFDFIGQVPLELTVTAILEDNLEVDNDVIFTSLETAWTIEGIGHGHIEESEEKGKKIQKINESTRKHFHFHGDMNDFPVTAFLVFPKDHKSKVITLGKFQSELDLQILESETVINELIGLLLKLKSIFRALMIPVLLSSFLLISLIISLMWKSRENERNTLTQLGCSRSFIAKQAISEYCFILLPSIMLSGIIFALISIFKNQILNIFLSL